MPRLIWVFAGRTVTLVVLSCRGSIIKILWATQTSQNWQTVLFNVVAFVFGDVIILFPESDNLGNDKVNADLLVALKCKYECEGDFSNGMFPNKKPKQFSLYPFRKTSAWEAPSNGHPLVMLLSIEEMSAMLLPISSKTHLFNCRLPWRVDGWAPNQTVE